MTTKEQAVRDAADALHTAIFDAVAAGYAVQWPTNAAGLPSIAVSETGKAGLIVQVRTPGLDPAVAERARDAAQAAADQVVAEAKTPRARVTNLDGSPIERDADGMIVGQPLNLTDEERAAMPILGPADPDAPNVLGTTVGSRGRRV